MKTKRILSLVLALVMVLSLLPTSVFAADTAAPASEYNYVFNSPAHNIQDDQRTLSSGYHTIETTVTSVSSGRWGFYGVKTGTGYSTTNDYAQWSSNIGTTPPVAGGSAIVFELEVPDGGVFTPTYNYTAGKNASKVDLYLVKSPESVTNAAGAYALATADENAYLGTVDCYEGTSATFDNVELADGNYLFVIAPNGANENWTALNDKYNYLYMDGFNLKRVKALVTHKFVFNTPAHGITQALVDEINANKAEGAADVTLGGIRCINSGYHTVERTVTSVSPNRWGYYSHRTSGSNYSTYDTHGQWSVKGDTVPEAGGMLMALELEITEGGKYKPSFGLYKNPNGPKIDLYLIKKPAIQTGAQAIYTLATDDDDSDSFFLGTVDSWAGTANTDALDPLSEVELDEGRYILLIAPNGANANWTAGLRVVQYRSLLLEPIIENEKAVEQEYITTIASLSSKLPNISSAVATEIGIQNGSTLRNWTLADWRMTAQDANGGTYKTLDTSKTDPYAIDIGTTKPTRIYGIYMSAKGLQANFQEGYHNNRVGANRTYLALRLDVEAGGKYKLQMKSDNRVAGNGSFDVHFVEAQDGAMNTTMADAVLGTTTPRAADGYYDFSPNGGENGKYYGVKTSEGEDLVVDVKPGGGEYWVVFYWNQNAVDRIPFLDATKTEYHAIWLSGIKLTPAEEEPETPPTPPAPTDDLTKIAVSANQTTLELGATATLKTTATYTLSGDKEITSGVTYTSGNTAVATVSGNTVTAVAEGQAKITATYEGKTSDITITVVDNSPAIATNTYEYKMTFDVLNSENMAMGADFASGDFLRNAHGGALYNKTKMNTKAQFAIGKDGNACEPYDVFKRSETADWEWASSYLNTLAITKNHNALFGDFQVGRYGNASSGYYFMLRLHVPEGGKYTLSFDANRKAGYCAPGIYFAKDDGSELSKDKNKDYSKFINGFVGYANCADTEKTGYVNIGTVEVAKGGGDYYLAVFPTADSKIKSPTSEATQTFEFRGFKLSPYQEGDDANDLLSIEATIPEYEFEIDGTADITVTAKYSRTGFEIMNSGVTFTSDKPDVVAVDGAKITAKAPGSATITAKVDGTNISDTFVVDVLTPDPGNAGVIREYKTTWKALQLDKLPVTSDSGLYNGSTYTRSGGLLMNTSLMNRNATSKLNANAEEVAEWRLMDESVTAPWDMAYQHSPGGVRIQKASNDLFLNYPVADYGSNSATILALRVEVPNKGTYNLSLDSNNVAHGINPAVYFFRDDGTLTSASAIREYVKTLTPAGYYSFSDLSQKGYKKLAEVEAPRQGEYFIVFVGDAKSKELNPTVATSSGKNYQHLYLKGIRLSAPAGALAKVNMSVESLRTEADPMALYTQKQISYTLADELNVPLDDIDASKLNVTYESSDSDVATVSEDGVISSLKNGTTEITVKVTYDGATAEAKWNLLVAPSSRNIAEHLNPHFDTDEWIWTGATNMPTVPATPVFARPYIDTEADGNRALRFELNPEVGAAGIQIFFKNDGHRLEVKPGEFYQMTFKFKTDYVVPSGAADFNMYFDIYTYNNATGTASSSIAFGSNRSTDFVTHPQFKEAQNGWTEVVIPLGAPTEYPADVIYITPRLVMRPTSADTGKLGYSGNFWIDDIDVREVGYAGVEIATTGAATEGQTLQVQAKPYTTLGHYISLGGDWTTDQAKFFSTDINVIKDFTNLALGKDGLGTNWLNATATAGGKNGTTEVSCDMEINGIVRTGKREITSSGYAMKLLYAEASATPSSIEAGATGSITWTGYMSDGSVADMTGGNVSYKSLTPDVVDVSADGTITAKRAGKGRVQVSLILGSAGTSAIAEVDVVDSSKIVSATLAECPTVGHLRDEQLIITGMMESGFAADIDAAEIEWVIESETENAISIDANNAVFGNVFGAKATVFAKITLNGATVETNTIEIEVVKTDLRDFFIDFNNAHPTKPKNVTIEEFGWELNTELSHSSALNGSFTTQGYNATTNSANRPLAIDIDIPYEGAYQIVFRGTFNNYNATVSDIYCDGTYVGSYEFYDGGRNSSAEPQRLRSVYLTAGKHTFIFNPLASGGRNYYQLITDIRFRALNDLPGIADIKTAKNEYSLIVGDKAELSAELLTADGFTYGWQAKYNGDADELASVSYESSDKSVATVDENGVITAIAAGEAEISIIANYSDAAMVKKIKVTVDGSDINTATFATDRRVFYVTEQIELGINATLASGAILDPSKMTVTWKSSDENVVSFDADGVMTAKAAGNATITATIAYFNEPPFEASADITVKPDGFAVVEISADKFVLSPNGATESFTAVAKTFLGNDVDMTGATITWASDNDEVAYVSQDGIVTTGAEGSANITAEVTINGETVVGEAIISVRAGKVGRTYYTDEMVAAARENSEKYSWAASIRRSTINRADKYLDKVDFLYEMIPGEGLPRTSAVGYRNDPDQWYCRYCGEYLYDKYGHYPYFVDVLQDPWKLQCQNCKRRFPSNDFAKLYELGRNEHGIYEIKLAEERNAALVEETEGKVDYMRNDLYPEIGTERHPKSVFLSEGEDPTRWGVDTGLGYTPGRTYSNGVKEVHTYIGYIMHCGIWYDAVGSGNTGVINRAIDDLGLAYMYTGDIKYGRAGAVLVDRIADVYPGYDLRPYLTRFANSDGGAVRGKIIGSIWETYLGQDFIAAYDAVFPAYDDPEVVKYLSGKAKKFNLENDKSTPEKIRQNCEDGILRETYKAVSSALSMGNTGMHQNSCAMAAVVLDTHPDTDEMIDWVFQYSESDSTSYNTGGGINQALVNSVNRDGQATESAFGYNRIWVTQLTDVANTLARYPEYDGMSLYEHPKYVGMIQSYPYVTLVRRGVPAIGDGGGAASYPVLPDNDDVMIQSFKYMRDIDYDIAVEIAQHMYFVKGSNLGNLHYDIWTKNPESLKKEVETIIKEYGEWNYDKSSMLTGYGLGILRAGTLHEATGSNVFRDTQRDFWIYFGGATSHNNNDQLSLGIEAYGIGMTTDLGYPEATGHDPNRAQWMNPTISHNAVVVNEKSQTRSAYSHVPLHYDAKDTRVKVLDVDGTPSYTETDEYRRTIVMIDYDSDVSYGIDFFKVRGGDDHLYSFHANSHIQPTSSLEFEQQIGGTYAGADVPFGNDPWTNVGNNYTILKYPVGYTWLFDIHRADNPGVSDFWIDYQINDFRKLSRNTNMDIHLRMTMVNDWNADEVTLANGMPPRNPSNLAAMNHLEYMLVRRKGRDLNTLFTTVIEPYNHERYIKSIESVSVEAIDGNPGKFDNAKAVKVEFVDGRTDYVVYTQNNSVTYRVADLFDFRGFVGVWTVNEDGDNIYTYINDGDLIGNEEEKVEGLDAALEGTIVDFQHDLSFDNWIDVKFDREVTEKEVEDLTDRMIVQDRTCLGNSSFVIYGAEKTGADTARLDLAGITAIDRFVDAKDETKGYKYDLDIGAHFTIPISYEDNQAPIFDAISDNLSTKAGSTITIKVNATAQDSDAGVTYKERQLPRGASFDAATGTVTWKPTDSQTGEGLFAIDATDEFGRTSTIYFSVEVYGATTGAGAGGGGGAAPAPSTPSKPVEDDKKEEDKKEDVPTTPTTPSTPSVEENVRFIDLGAHAWAADAINALAEDGIIKGTSENTFSPAANITRADFALLLVRAFKLSSDNTENFADVAETDYFAKELAIARNTGIAGGIGDNKYAPRNTITRQDMMTIVYRALIALKIELKTGEVEYDDFANVADYAKDAVSALITSGLVNGKSGKIAPTDYTTRAEVAVLIKRILDYTK